jgi:hypothetical protein
MQQSEGSQIIVRLIHTSNNGIEREETTDIFLVYLNLRSSSGMAFAELFQFREEGIRRHSWKEQEKQALGGLRQASRDRVIMLRQRTKR